LRALRLAPPPNAVLLIKQKSISNPQIGAHFAQLREFNVALSYPNLTLIVKWLQI
jgi:hypothetical protein